MGVGLANPLGRYPNCLLPHNLLGGLKMQGIYKIWNRISRKYYVGSSSNVEKRWREHRGALRKGKHLNNYLQNAWNKHGKKAFEFKFVEEVGNEQNLHSVEQEYLDAGFELGLLYNIARLAAGGSVAGWRHTEEALAKMSNANSGKNNPMYGKTGEDSPNYGRKNPEHSRRMLGKRHTEEAKQNMRASWTPERRREKSKQMSGEKNPFYGKRRSEETKAKISKTKSKAHPAFGNVMTGEFIPAGHNLRKLCQERNINYNTLLSLRDNKFQQSRNGWRLAKNEWWLATKDDFVESNAQPYPAFFNIETKEFLPAGHNLAKLCRERNLNYGVLQTLRCGGTKLSVDGWRLAHKEAK